MDQRKKRKALVYCIVRDSIFAELRKHDVVFTAADFPRSLLRDLADVLASRVLADSLIKVCLNRSRISGDGLVKARKAR